MNTEEKKIVADFPRPGSAEYSFLFGSKEERSKTLKQWKLMNKILTIPLYQIGIIPLLRINKIFLLLYTKGRKSGKRRITPLEYRTKDGVINVGAAKGKKAHWFRNLLANPDEVMIKTGFRKFKASFTILENIKEKNEYFIWYVDNFPTAAKFLFGWDPKTDDLKNSDFTAFSELVEVVQFYPKE